MHLAARPDVNAQSPSRLARVIPFAGSVALCHFRTPVSRQAGLGQLRPLAQMLSSVSGGGEFQSTPVNIFDTQITSDLSRNTDLARELPSHVPVLEQRGDRTTNELWRFRIG